MTRRIVAVPIALAATLIVPHLAAQSGKIFKGRMAPVPMTTSQASTIAGVGSVSASLTGTKVTISGTFEGLKSPATIAQVHRAPRGLRGPVVFELKVTKTGDGTTGTIAGTFDLTSQQVTDLEKGWLYAQLHSEKAADGNLWGWLLLQEKR